MKHLFVALLCSLCWVQGWADSLPLNQFDKRFPALKKHNVFGRFRVFSAPQQDKDGAYILGESTSYNEGTFYYILDGHLYIDFSGTLFHIMPMQPLPALEGFHFYPVTSNNYGNIFSPNAKVQEMNGQNFTLPCGDNSFVQFTEKIEPGKPPSMENIIYYLITWTENGKTHTFSHEETFIYPMDAPPGRFAFCDGNILYFDGADAPSVSWDKARRGIFFYDLKNRRRGVYSATPFEQGEKKEFYAYNPIGIPGTDWMLYLKENDESEKNSLEQVVVRKRLTQAQADKAAWEYRLWHENQKKNKTNP